MAHQGTYDFQMLRHELLTIKFENLNMLEEEIIVEVNVHFYGICLRISIKRRVYLYSMEDLGRTE